MRGLSPSCRGVIRIGYEDRITAVTVVVGTVTRIVLMNVEVITVEVAVARALIVSNGRPDWRNAVVKVTDVQYTLHRTLV